MRQLTRGLWYRSLAWTSCILLYVSFSESMTVRAADEDSLSNQQVTQEDIDRAVERAKKFLLTKELQGTVSNLNRQALGVLALLKAEVPVDTPVMSRILDRVAARCRDGKYSPVRKDIPVYESSVFLMALANGDPVKYRREIEILTQWLISDIQKFDAWTYPAQANTGGDTSQTQYALLALWEASRAGVVVPQEVFARAARWHLKSQSVDGGFAYHPQEKTTDGTVSTLSMTSAGIGSLHICRLNLFPGAAEPNIAEAMEAELALENAKKKKKRDPNKLKFGVLEVPAEVKTKLETAASKSSSAATANTRLSAIDNSIGKALNWMNVRFKVINPGSWPLYYLYTLERMSALTGAETIAGQDWYLEGARYLVASQGKNGGWSARSGNVASTAFGLMFLTRATHKALNRRRSVKRTPGGLLAGGRGLPDDLAKVNVEGGEVKQRKFSGPVDELLAVLENPKNKNFFDAQEALVETVVIKDPKALVGKTDRLLKLAKHPNAEVRRTAMWALGRSQNISVSPVLIDALGDTDLDVVIEARNGLRFLNKNIDGFGLPDQPKPADQQKAIARWRQWYLSIRPYDERDDLTKVAP